VWRKCVSAFTLNNNYKWRRWVLTVAAYRRARSPSRLTLSEGRQPHCAESAFMKWTEWTLAVAMSWWQRHGHCYENYMNYCRRTVCEGTSFSVYYRSRFLSLTLATKSTKFGRLIDGSCCTSLPWLISLAQGAHLGRQNAEGRKNCNAFWATVCKTVRFMLSVRCPVMSCPVCL